MKNILVRSAIMLSLIFIFSTSGAQVSVNVNIGMQPVWGPIGYDYVEYYYLPEYDIYYYVPQQQFVYLNGANWVFVRTLPPRFRTVNFYHTYKVVINEPKAYLHYNVHRVEYLKYKSNGGKQVVIRDSKEPKYFVVKDHPMHGKANDNRKHIKDNDNNERSNARDNNQQRKVKDNRGPANLNHHPQHGNSKNQEVKIREHNPDKEQHRQHNNGAVEKSRENKGNGQENGKRGK